MTQAIKKEPLRVTLRKHLIRQPDAKVVIASCAEIDALLRETEEYRRALEAIVSKSLNMSLQETRDEAVLALCRVDTGAHL